jgi:hypothetical protein
MKPNELRIGNWVKLFNDEFNKIHVISKTAIQVEGGIIGGEVFKLEQIQPIPLTPEILEKCGFVKQYDECVFDFGNSRIEQVIWADSEPEWKFRRILGNDLTSWRHGMIAINYLHQLQNLVFALTGEELTFKNETP